jgi:hypothetical protein
VGNKAVEEWIAKARESLHEFGAFIGIGGAGMPKSYLVREDFEDSDDDQEYSDAPEDLDGEPRDEDRIGVAVENPDGEDIVYDPSRPQQPDMLRHKSSNSSMGTVGTVGTANTGLPRPKRNANDNAKSSTLPVEASPFGLFGKLAIATSPRSRASSAEPEEEDKGSGIANDNFFKSSMFISFFDHSEKLIAQLISARSECSWTQAGERTASDAIYLDSGHHHSPGG